MPTMSLVIGLGVLLPSAPISIGAQAARDTTGTPPTGTDCVASPQSIERAAALINRYSDRVLFGTDVVAPSTPRQYFAVYEQYAPFWRALSPDASAIARTGNYERLFNAARRKVRAWASTHTN